MGKERIEYLDAIRGFTIILVVFSHIVVLMLHTRCEPNNIFIIFRMPLFFFISGFFSYAVYTRALIKKRIGNRIRKQLLTTLVALCAYALVFHLNLNRCLADDGKVGYWFTPVVVEFFLTYMLIVSAFNRFKVSQRWQTLVLASLSVVFICLFISIDGNGSFRDIGVVKYGSLYFYILYFPFFFLGVLAKMHFAKFTAFISNRFVVLGLFLAFLGGFLVDNPWCHYAQRIVSVMLIFRFFQYFSHFFSKATWIGAQFSHAGRYTLEIYLLHYFVIRWLAPLVRNMDLHFLQIHWSLQLIAYTMLAVCICIAVILCCKMCMRIVRALPAIPRPSFGG